MIPPAWGTCGSAPTRRAHPGGRHDAGGRRQYRYHDRLGRTADRTSTNGCWSSARSCRAARGGGRDWRRGLPRERALAARSGSSTSVSSGAGGEEYAAENGSFGLATIRREQVTVSRGQIIFTYPGKAGSSRNRRWPRTRSARSSAASSAAAAATGCSPTGTAGAGMMSPPPTSTTTCARYPAASSPPRTSVPGTPPSWPPSASPCPRAPSPRPRGAGRSRGCARRWPAYLATPRRWRGPPISIPGSSACMRWAERLRPRWPGWKGKHVRGPGARPAMPSGRS